MKYICILCGREFEHRKQNDRIIKYCSQRCYGDSKKGKPGWNKGIPCRLETKRKLALIFRGKRRSPKTEFKRKDFLGSKNPNWIVDRSKVSTLRNHTDLKYLNWRNSVWKRDGWKCQMSDRFCDDRIQAHHIMPWALYPKLRYKISNGITLCKKHHPLKKENVIRLAPIFQDMVNKIN